MLEWLPKSKYSQQKKQITTWFSERVKKQIEQEFNVNCFIYLTGSGKRKLVLHNDGVFDLDFQIWLSQSKKRKPNQNFEPEKIKLFIFNAFKEMLEKPEFWKLEDSTTAITMKKLNEKISGGIEYSYDLVVVFKHPKTSESQVIKRTKNGSKFNYIWNKLSNEANDFEIKVKKIKELHMWKDLRDIYKNKKITNLKNTSKTEYVPKKSYQLYIESVNEVFDKIQ
ncbi:hypothetical protein [Mesoplasma corruscae]|uniref:Nucleotidyltransferase n=1 Tax=Mesoplasma corruscae TaxID=216874 RepID=A0A2S5RH60_9MOLU|nr:hypothetical protein [Mesoplasma corruscae]PPE06640.1 hypothetical protein MCORR_v1c02710 [Mesoplasma corruscae]